MIHLLLKLVTRPQEFSSDQSDNPQSSQPFANPTLLHVNHPDESCNRQFLKEDREPLGIEPATRTVVSSTKSEHQVHMLLLKDIRLTDDTVIRN